VIALAPPNEIVHSFWPKIAIPNHLSVSGNSQSVLPVPVWLVFMKSHYLGDLMRFMRGILEAIPCLPNQPEKSKRINLYFRPPQRRPLPPPLRSPAKELGNRVNVQSADRLCSPPALRAHNCFPLEPGVCCHEIGQMLQDVKTGRLAAVARISEWTLDQGPADLRPQKSATRSEILVQPLLVRVIPRPFARRINVDVVVEARRIQRKRRLYRWRREKGPKWQGERDQQRGCAMDFSRTAQRGDAGRPANQLPCGNSSCPTATGCLAITDGATVARSAITKSSFPKIKFESRRILRNARLFFRNQFLSCFIDVQAGPLSVLSSPTVSRLGS